MKLWMACREVPAGGEEFHTELAQCSLSWRNDAAWVLVTSLLPTASVPGGIREARQHMVLSAELAVTEGQSQPFVLACFVRPLSKSPDDTR